MTKPRRLIKNLLLIANCDPMSRLLGRPIALRRRFELTAQIYPALTALQAKLIPTLLKVLWMMGVTVLCLLGCLSAACTQ